MIGKLRGRPEDDDKNGKGGTKREACACTRTSIRQRSLQTERFSDDGRFARGGKM